MPEKSLHKDRLPATGPHTTSKDVANAHPFYEMIDLRARTSKAKRKNIV